jgi:hypothetical protein
VRYRPHAAWPTTNHNTIKLNGTPKIHATMYRIFHSSARSTRKKGANVSPSGVTFWFGVAWSRPTSIAAAVTSATIR